MQRTLLSLLAVAAWATAQQPTPAPAPAEAPHARIAEIEIRLDEAEDPAAQLPFGPKRLNYYGFLRFVRKAAHDPRLDAVILKPRSYGVGWARLLEVRSALRQLRRSGKKVFFFRESLETPDLVLASVADRISIPESAVVAIPGLALESWYMKGLLEKLHLRFDVVHIGDYKTAGESLVRDSMSPELRESLDPVLDELYSSIVKAIAEGRGLEEARVREAMDRGVLTAKEAKAAGLVDRIEYYDQFKEGIKASFAGRKLKRAKDYETAKGTKIDATNFMAIVFGSLFGATEPEVKGTKIALVYCTGPITSGKSRYDWSGNVASMGSETIVKAIDKVAKDGDVKAIVLRINSPGGSALASDMIWRAVERAKAKKPVIASMGDVAASGGYYIATNSTAIVAEPQTITGSIGVVGLIPDVDGFYSWVGINPQRMHRGKHAPGMLTTKALSDEDKALLRHLLGSIYEDFVAKVAAGRGKTPAEIEPIAQGRIWTGRDALSRGLVDRLGGIEDALALARERGGIEAGAQEGEDFHVVEYPRRAGPFEMLEEMMGMRLGIDQLALRRLPVLRRVLAHLGALKLVARDRVCAIAPELSGLSRVCSPAGD